MKKRAAGSDGYRLLENHVAGERFNRFGQQLVELQI
jgi:hypothetical protein